MIIGEEYWFCNVHWPDALPKQVKVIDISRNVVIFDQYVGSEKYADKREIKTSLFDTYNLAIGALIPYLKENPYEHFIDDYHIEHLEKCYPEAWL